MLENMTFSEQNHRLMIT